MAPLVSRQTVEQPLRFVADRPGRSRPDGRESLDVTRNGSNKTHTSVSSQSDTSSKLKMSTSKTSTNRPRQDMECPRHAPHRSNIAQKHQDTNHHHHHHNNHQDQSNYQQVQVKNGKLKRNEPQTMQDADYRACCCSCCCCLECVIKPSEASNRTRITRTDSTTGPTRIKPTRSRPTRPVSDTKSSQCSASSCCSSVSIENKSFATTTKLVDCKKCHRTNSTAQAGQKMVIMDRKQCKLNMADTMKEDAGNEGRNSTSCSDSDRLKEDEAEISSLEAWSVGQPDEHDEQQQQQATGRARKLRQNRATTGHSINRWSSSGSLGSSLISLNDLSTRNRLSEQVDSNKQQQQQQQKVQNMQEIQRTRPVHASSVQVLSSSSQVAMGAAAGRPKRRPAPLPPNMAHQEHQANKARSQSVASLPHVEHQKPIGGGGGGGQQQTKTTNGLLSDQEVHCIEHFLKSHKSSVYVCGCMANLYFTRTHLADNGRASKASVNDWKLNKTGVPVLIFDSGLTRNRNKRRLSISLAERGSGFVLWSDTIDHLSNYRAFSARLHSIDQTTSQQQDKNNNNKNNNNEQDDTCDSFHVMYLSSNHRIMVGLSFDDSICARLFLAQIELVCADPANIALTGPKESPTAMIQTSALSLDAGQQMVQPSKSSGCYERRLPHVSPVPVPMMDRLLASFKRARGCSRRRQARPSSTGIGQLLSPPTSWSTLKRAAQRLGSNQQQVAAVRKLANSSLAINENDELGQTRTRSASDQRLLVTFRPRPLAQLAAEGKVWHKSKRGQLKRMPRKCDISAPCLFQHVTSVDLTNLDQLYSRSFVASKQMSSLDEIANIGYNQKENDKETHCTSDEIRNEKQQVNMVRPRELAQLTATDEQTTNMNMNMNQSATTSSLSSSSSCYSSGSCSTSAPRSPTSSNSECDAEMLAQRHEVCVRPARFVGNGNIGHHHDQNNQQGARTRQAFSGAPCARPPVPPPKPPQRSSDALSSSTMSANCRTDRAEQVAVADLVSNCASSEPATRISSIIKELQTQVPGELVDAKRRLMADIAGQVMLSRSARGLDSNQLGELLHPKKVKDFSAEHNGDRSKSIRDDQSRKRQQQQQYSTRQPPAQTFSHL